MMLRTRGAVAWSCFANRHASIQAAFWLSPLAENDWRLRLALTSHNSPPPSVSSFTARAVQPAW
jgi:hypothetical protein